MGLKASFKRVGRLYPILLDKHGNVVGGLHRLAADESWPKMRLENVETEEQRLMARLISNACRRHVPAEEKTEILGRLGEIYLSEGVKSKGIAQKIMEKTGMSYRWVMKYLPDKYKERPQKHEFLTRENKVARRATREELLKELLTPPKREGALKVKKYANTDFVSLTLEKPFYQEFEKASLELGVSTEISALKSRRLPRKDEEGISTQEGGRRRGSKNDGRRQDSHTSFHQT